MCCNRTTTGHLKKISWKESVMSFSLSLKCQTYRAVVPNTGCLPASIVAAGVTLVQLEAIVFVPAHVQQRDTKRPLPCKDKPYSCYRAPTSSYRDENTSVFLQISLKIHTRSVKAHKILMPIKTHIKPDSASYPQTVCTPAWCHTGLWPAAHRVSAPGTAINIWREAQQVSGFMMNVKDVWNLKHKHQEEEIPSNSH